MKDGAGARSGPHRVAAVVLAAGSSSRMGATNKLLVELDGVAMVRRVADTVIRAGLDPVVVVLGHDGDAVRRALDGLPVRFTVNPEHATGMGSSVRAGIRAVAGSADGAMIVLGDMPWVPASDLHALVHAFAPEEGRGICAPVVQGRRGNPVLWGARYFAELEGLSGDTGARHLLERHAADFHEVPVPGDGVLRDIDTPAALHSTHVEDG